MPFAYASIDCRGQTSYADGGDFGGFSGYDDYVPAFEAPLSFRASSPGAGGREVEESKAAGSGEARTRARQPTLIASNSISEVGCCLAAMTIVRNRLSLFNICFTSARRQHLLAYRCGTGGRGLCLAHQQRPGVRVPPHPHRAVHGHPHRRVQETGTLWSLVCFCSALLNNMPVCAVSDAARSLVRERDERRDEAGSCCRLP